VKGKRDMSFLKIGQPVRILSQKGKCRLITKVEAINWQLKNITVHNFVGRKQVVHFDKVKPV
jgi:hypothetical protein